MKKNLFANRHLYLVTNLKKHDPSIFKKADSALKGGADILQLRSKTLLDGAFLEIGEKLKKIAHSRRKLFIVNDRPHIAKLLKADGLHLGQDDLPIKEARKIVGSRMIIGKSTHSLKQAVAAEKEEPDYIGVGPIYATPTKPNYKYVGLELIRQVSKKVKLPFVAIGGIDSNNVAEVVRSGARCVALVRAIFDAKNPEKSSRIIKNIIKHEAD